MRVTPQLDPASLIATAEQLERRVSQRFPERGIRDRAAGLVELARRADTTGAAISEPILWVRLSLASSESSSSSGSP